MPLRKARHPGLDEQRASRPPVSVADDRFQGRKNLHPIDIVQGETRVDLSGLRNRDSVQIDGDLVADAGPAAPVLHAQVVPGPDAAAHAYAGHAAAQQIPEVLARLSRLLDFLRGDLVDAEPGSEPAALDFAERLDHEGLELDGARRHERLDPQIPARLDAHVLRVFAVGDVLHDHHSLAHRHAIDEKGAALARYLLQDPVRDGDADHHARNGLEGVLVENAAEDAARARRRFGILGDGGCGQHQRKDRKRVPEPSRC